MQKMSKINIQYTQFLNLKVWNNPRQVEMPLKSITQSWNKIVFFNLKILELSRGYCRSWYDAEITQNRQWRQRITEDLPDASKMYDWKHSFYLMYKN